MKDMSIEKRPWENFWDHERPDFIETRGQDKRIYPYLAKLASEMGISILDVGCASCLIYPHCEHLGLRYIGLDITVGFLERARELYPEIEVRHGTVLDLPFPDRSFDTVLAKALIEHLNPDECKAAIDEMIRVASKQLLIVFFRPPEQGRTEISQLTEYLYFSVKYNVADFESMLINDRVLNFKRTPYGRRNVVYIITLK